MIFTSLTYLLFLSLIIFFYWSLGKTARLILIFLGSITFYGFWNFNFVPLLLISIFINYFTAQKIDNCNTAKAKQFYLIIAIIINILILAVFKYFYFIETNVIGLANLLGFELSLTYLKIVLPIGISFYTFQAISYIIDVYRGIIKPEKNILLFSDYIIFFPQLIAGPILRANEVIWQLNTRPKFNYIFIEEGSKRILIGLFLKLVIADNIAPFVDMAFAVNSIELSPFDILTMAFLFGFQIYFDFSAYSHIAIGSAKLMGINFPENFNFPYSSTSPKIFWKRWHISLSSWVRDYLYLPITGSKFKTKSLGGFDLENTSLKFRIVISLFFSWAIMGLWHGAGWNFIIWGITHAIIIYVFRVFPNKFDSINKKLRNVISWGITLILVMLAWIPFRSENLEHTIYLWRSLFNFDRILILNFRENFYLITFGLLVFVMIASYLNENKEKFKIFKLFNTSLYSKLLIIILSMTVFIYIRPTVQFIYFQF